MHPDDPHPLDHKSIFELALMVQELRTDILFKRSNDEFDAMHNQIASAHFCMALDHMEIAVNQMKLAYYNLK